MKGYLYRISGSIASIKAIESPQFFSWFRIQSLLTAHSTTQDKKNKSKRFFECFYNETFSIARQYSHYFWLLPTAVVAPKNRSHLLR